MYRHKSEMRVAKVIYFGKNTQTPTSYPHTPPLKLGKYTHIHLPLKVEKSSHIYTFLSIKIPPSGKMRQFNIVLVILHVRAYRVIAIFRARSDARVVRVLFHEFFL